jgi:hypothetical protein
MLQFWAAPLRLLRAGLAVMTTAGSVVAEELAP